jgi:hypothetical protein
MGQPRVIQALSIPLCVFSGIVLSSFKEWSRKLAIVSLRFMAYAPRDYRIVYLINDSKHEVEIFKIGHRKK